MWVCNVVCCFEILRAETWAAEQTWRRSTVQGSSLPTNSSNAQPNDSKMLIFTLLISIISMYYHSGSTQNYWWLIWFGWWSGFTRRIINWVSQKNPSKFALQNKMCMRNDYKMFTDVHHKVYHDQTFTFSKRQHKKIMKWRRLNVTRKKSFCVNMLSFGLANALYISNLLHKGQGIYCDALEQRQHGAMLFNNTCMLLKRALYCCSLALNDGALFTMSMLAFEKFIVRNKKHWYYLEIK